MQISFQPIKPEDVEKIFQFQKELIERYEDLSSINCEKVFAWCKKKIQVTMQDYRRIMVGKELAEAILRCTRKFPGSGNWMTWTSSRSFRIRESAHR